MCLLLFYCRIFWKFCLDLNIKIFRLDPVRNYDISLVPANVVVQLGPPPPDRYPLVVIMLDILSVDCAIDDIKDLQQIVRNT